MIELTSNVDLVRADFNKKVGSYKRKMKNTLNAAANEFKEFIVKTQMSGRPGLKRRTGRLIRDFNVKTNSTTAGFETFVTNDSDYIRYHQYGEGHNPKRLHIVEEWQKTGTKMFEKAINAAMKELEK